VEGSAGPISHAKKIMAESWLKGREGREKKGKDGQAQDS